MSIEASFSTRIYRAVAWSAGLRVASQVVTWVITLVLVRLLTPGDYGLMAAAGFYFGLLVIVRELGLPAAIVQQRLEGEDLARVFGAVLLAHWALFALVIVTAPWLADVAGQEKLTDVLRVMALPLLIMAFGTVGRALLQRALDFRRIAIVELVSAILSAIISFACALMGLGVWALVAGLVSQYTLNTLLFLLWTPERVRPRFDLAKLFPQLRFGSMVFSSSIAATCSGMMPAFIIGRVFGAHPAGLWALSNDLAEILASRVMPIVTAVAFPAVAEVQGQVDRLRDYFRRGGALIAFFTFPILFGMAATSTEVVPLLLGPQWVEAAAICAFLCIRSAFWTVASLMSPIIVGLGRPELLLRNSIWRLALTVAAAVFGARTGIEAFAAALVAVELMLVLMNLRMIAPLLGSRLLPLAANFLPPVFNATAMAGGVWVFGAHFAHGWGIVPTLAAKVALGIVLYGILAALIDRACFATAVQILRQGTQAGIARLGFAGGAAKR
jgi:O-antigen/teichoic acid export membrane protein